MDVPDEEQEFEPSDNAALLETSVMKEGEGRSRPTLF
jgi:hypothetical protein